MAWSNFIITLGMVADSAVASCSSHKRNGWGPCLKQFHAAAGVGAVVWFMKTDVRKIIHNGAAESEDNSRVAGGAASLWWRVSTSHARPPRRPSAHPSHCSNVEGPHPSTLALSCAPGSLL